MKICVVQYNPTVGDVVGNSLKIRRLWENAARQKADLVVSAEMSLTGYPLDDLALRGSFIEDVKEAVNQLATMTENGPGLLVGAPWQENGRLQNACLLLADGKIAGKYFKRELPNYGVFDEVRVFTQGAFQHPLVFKDMKIGLMVCEDMWLPDVPRYLKEKGAQFFVVVNGSPYESDKLSERQAIARERCLEHNLPLLYVNQIGGQDDLVFDGASFAMDAKGEIRAQLSAFTDDTLMTEWNQVGNTWVPDFARIERQPIGAEADYRAIIRGLQDYVAKNGFKDVLLGLSGGIDSALVAVLAVDALGADHVHTVMMPSMYTSNESISDAFETAKALGCAFSILPIHQPVNAFSDVLAPVFGAFPEDFTEENLQSRARGVLLMALSNKLGHLLLATGNKSELCTGYATLYGDMCGGYAPIKDLYKTDVYKIARYAVLRNGPVIPEHIFTKPPSAELKPNQKDQDSLPPYEILDDVLRGLVERDMSFVSLVEQGFDLALVKRVWSMLQRAEYKRRQAPVGPKITRRHISKDRRYPITSGYCGS